MGEWFLALAMLFLAIGHVLLIKKCASIESEIPHHTDGLKTLMGEVRDLLDEALDLLADTPSSSSLPAKMNHAESIPNLIFSTLLSRMNMGATDGTTEPNQWEIYETNDEATEPTVESVEHN